MRKVFLATIAVAALAFPAAASAHHVSYANLSCNQLDFTYADYSPNSSETLIWTANGKEFDQQVFALNGTQGTFSSTPPDLGGYQGETIDVYGHRSGFSDGTFTAELTTAYCQAEQGPPGVAGVPGATGSQGPAGPAGKNGTNGANGAPGKNGTNGANGTNGKRGTNGKSCHCRKKRHHKHHRQPKVCKLAGGATHRCGAPLPPPVGNG